VRPSYVAIITDGNGRWAQQRGLSVAEGHEAGADTVKARLRDAVDLGVRELTVYSFSTENWSRSPEEVGALMGMFSERILGETPELDGEGEEAGQLDRTRPLVEPEQLVQAEDPERGRAGREHPAARGDDDNRQRNRRDGDHQARRQVRPAAPRPAAA